MGILPEVSYGLTVSLLTLLGVYKGTLDQWTAYVSHMDADLWVAQAGAPDMFHTFSILPLSLSEELAAIEGVSEAHRGDAAAV